MSIAEASSLSGDETTVVEGVADGAVDRGCAANRVGVLHSNVVVVGVAGDDGGVGEHRPKVRGAHRLARLRPECLEFGGERGVGGQQSLDGHRGDHVGLSEEAFDVGDGEAEHAEDAVGAVGDGEALLLGEFDRFEAGVAERVGGGTNAAVVHDVAFAEQRQCAVGERSEVAAGAERAVLGHDRRDAGVEDVDHRLGDERPGAAVAERERSRPQQHHRPNHFVFDRVAHAGGVGTDECDLKCTSTLGWDRDGGERAEAGGDAVLGCALGELFDDRSGCRHALDRCGCEFDAFGSAGDGDDVADGDAGSVEVDGHDVKSSPLVRSSCASASTAWRECDLMIRCARCR